MYELDKFDQLLPGLRSTRLLAKEICGESAWNFWANPIWKRSRWTSLRKVTWMLIKLDDGMSFNDFDIFWYMFYRCAHIYINTRYMRAMVKLVGLDEATYGGGSSIHFHRKQNTLTWGDRWVQFGHPPLVDLSLKVSQNLTYLSIKSCLIMSNLISKQDSCNLIQSNPVYLPSGNLT